MSEIERSLAGPDRQLYAVLVDCQKAFDLAPRHRMIEAFRRAGINGQLLKVIESFYRQDTLLVNIGGNASVEVTQNRGTPQGDPLSCCGFSLLLAELPGKLKDEFRTGTIAMFADDIILMHRNRLQAQRMFDVVNQHLEEEGLRINPAKTKVLKIRKGGPLASTDRITWKGQSLEFVSSAKYLGIRLQTSGTCFTDHVEEVCCKTLAIMYGETGDPYNLSVDTALKLFYVKAMPKLSYGMKRLWVHLTEGNLEEYERCFCAYLKRVFRLAKNSQNRYVYVIAGLDTPFVEVMRVSLRAETTPATEVFMKKWRKKYEEAKGILEGDPILERRSQWSAPRYPSRHLFARYLVHGYHHQICITEGFHDPSDVCVCRYCGENCPRYHAILCEQGPGLKQLGELRSIM